MSITTTRKRYIPKPWQKLVSEKDINPNVVRYLIGLSDLLATVVDRNYLDKYGNANGTNWPRAARNIRHLADEAKRILEARGVMMTFDEAQILPDILIDLNFTNKHVHMEVIHVMRLGSTVCGMSGQPHEWPKGHTRVSMDDVSKITCAVCRGILDNEGLDRGG